MVRCRKLSRAGDRRLARRSYAAFGARPYRRRAPVDPRGSAATTDAIEAEVGRWLRRDGGGSRTVAHRVGDDSVDRKRSDPEAVQCNATPKPPPSAPPTSETSTRRYASGPRMLPPPLPPAASPRCPHLGRILPPGPGRVPHSTALSLAIGSSRIRSAPLPGRAERRGWDRA